MERQVLTRRSFLRVTGLSATVAAVSACAGATPAPTEAPPATATPAEAPAAETPVPASRFGEAPMLAEMVQAGTLPPVEERLPREPLVITPVEEVGQYGGDWKTVTTGSLYQEWYSLFEPMITYTPDFTGLVPVLAKNWEWNEDGTVITIYLREGVRWSDGEPFTADDVMFWWEDVALNAELTPTVPSAFQRAGEPAVVEKVDDYTIRITFAAPNGMFEEILPNQWMYAPAHYMKQYHAKYASKEELDAAMAEEGFDTWVDLYGAKAASWNNPGCPYLSAWVVQNTVDQPVHVFERNPYYWKVDTAGNQLPYLDGKKRTLVPDAEAALLKAVAGEVDFEWHSAPGGLANRPTVIENQEKGDYRIISLVNPGTNYGTIYFNYAHSDPFLKQLFHDLNFRIAFSIAFDRNEINDLLFKGLATPSAATCAVASPWFEQSFADAYIQFDPDRANQLLDELGLTERDSEGYRLRPDGQRLSLVNSVFTPWPAENVEIQEIIKDYLGEVGIEIVVKPTEQRLWVPYVHGLSHDIASYASNLGFAGNPPVLRETFCTQEGNQHWAPQWGLWYASGGKEGEEPPAEIKQLQDMYEQIMGETSADRRIEMQKAALQLHAENIWQIGVLAEPDAGRYGVAKNYFRNVPEEGYPTQPPQIYPTSQFFIKS
ncbi:MAG: ABC transporter substrate-binding protein [Anaerolineae bacterium]|nr:ABC transporter substrate-binding protein [Anaerolineae bacterium]